MSEKNTDFTPEKASIDLLRELHDAGFINPMLYGGAVRDDYLRTRLGLDVPTNDYNILSGIDMKRVFGVLIQNDETAKAKLIAHVHQNFSGSLIEVKHGVERAILHSSATEPFTASIRFTYQGKNIHIIFDNEDAERALSSRLWGGEPINRIATDRDGCVVADEKFAAHAHDRIYEAHDHSPWGDRELNPRFKNLQKRIPGLRYEHHQGETKTVIPFNRAAALQEAKPNVTPDAQPLTAAIQTVRNWLNTHKPSVGFPTSPTPS